jgi:hypothetical protein
MCFQLPELPLFALERAAPGRWLVRAPSDDPLLPAVVAIAAVEEPAYAGTSKWQAANTVVMMRSYPPPPGPAKRGKPNLARELNMTWADYGDVSWRHDLLQLAQLIDALSPERDDPEAFYVKKNAVSMSFGDWRSGDQPHDAKVDILLECSGRHDASIRAPERRQWFQSGAIAACVAVVAPKLKMLLGL